MAPAPTGRTAAGPNGAAAASLLLTSLVSAPSADAATLELVMSRVTAPAATDPRLPPPVRVQVLELLAEHAATTPAMLEQLLDCRYSAVLVALARAQRLPTGWMPRAAPGVRLVKALLGEPGAHASEILQRWPHLLADQAVALAAVRSHHATEALRGQALRALVTTPHLPSGAALQTVAEAVARDPQLLAEIREHPRTRHAPLLEAIAQVVDVPRQVQQPSGERTDALAWLSADPDPADVHAWAQAEPRPAILLRLVRVCRDPAGALAHAALERAARDTHAWREQPTRRRGLRLGQTAAAVLDNPSVPHDAKVRAATLLFEHDEVALHGHHRQALVCRIMSRDLTVLSLVARSRWNAYLRATAVQTAHLPGPELHALVSRSVAAYELSPRTLLEIGVHPNADATCRQQAHKHLMDRARNGYATLDELWRWYPMCGRTPVEQLEALTVGDLDAARSAPQFVQASVGEALMVWARREGAQSLLSPQTAFLLADTLDRDPHLPVTTLLLAGKALSA